MKILFLPNWKVKKCDSIPSGLQPPDFFIDSKNYWFFKYMLDIQVDILDISSLQLIENLERNFFRFYIIQAVRAFFRMSKYDLILSHGMQSGIVLAFFRKVFKLTKTPHIAFDIGSFNSAAESGLVLKLMQFASTSLNGIIYHTSLQKNYYQKCFPWLLKKSVFIPFGTDTVFFNPGENNLIQNTEQSYILCIGYAKRDWDTLIKAYSGIKTNTTLKIIGNPSLKSNDSRIELTPRVSIVKLIELIQKSLFCILPLQWFNYSYGQMTLLQQMALGKTVIVANVPPVADYIIDRKTALFYNPEDSVDLQNKIEKCLDNKYSLDDIGKQAAFHVRNNFNEKIMAGKIECFIKTITLNN